MPTGIISIPRSEFFDVLFGRARLTNIPADVHGMELHNNYELQSFVVVGSSETFPCVVPGGALPIVRADVESTLLVEYPSVRTVILSYMDSGLEINMQLSLYDIIKEWGPDNGYDGLFNSDVECACKFDDLAPCGELNCDDCRFGHLLVDNDDEFCIGIGEQETINLEEDEG